MTGSQHCHFPGRSNGINFCYALCGHCQLIWQVWYFQFGRRGGLGSINPHKVIVVHTIDNAQRCTIHPVIPYNTIGIRSSSRINSGHRRWFINIDKIIFCIQVYSAFLPQPFEAPFSIQSRESFNVVCPQLVDGKPYHQLRNRRNILCLKPR